MRRCVCRLLLYIPFVEIKQLDDAKAQLAAQQSALAKAQQQASDSAKQAQDAEAARTQLEALRAKASEAALENRSRFFKEW